MDQNKLYEYLLVLGDNSMILGHRLSELCGHGPNLETDIALTNISLDLFGQVRNYFQYAAKIKGGDSTEDSIAHSRLDRDFRNVWLCEQENKDFAYVIARQFLFDAFHLPLLNALQSSSDEQISAIAKKSLKEVKYHFRFSSEWMKRLGDGTELSQQKLQAAIDYLYPFSFEFFEETDLEKEMKEAGIGADLTSIQKQYQASIEEIFAEAKIKIPDSPARQTRGKNGIHSELLGYILAEFQFIQRAYPNMQW